MSKPTCVTVSPHDDRIFVADAGLDGASSRIHVFGQFGDWLGSCELPTGFVVTAMCTGPAEAPPPTWASGWNRVK
jgi:hypothetical protein